MELHRIVAPDASKATAEALRLYGPEALVISTRRLKNSRTEVIVATEETEHAGGLDPSNSAAEPFHETICRKTAILACRTDRNLINAEIAKRSCQDTARLGTRLERQRCAIQSHELTERFCLGQHLESGRRGPTTSMRAYQTYPSGGREAQNRRTRRNVNIFKA